MSIRKAIIPAAGYGTRFLPATKAQPKEMLPIVDKPTIQFIVEEAVASGIEDILIITGRNKRAIEDHFDKAVELEQILLAQQQGELYSVVRDLADLVDIHYVRQKEPLGLGHAVWCARKFIGDEPFAVLLGDDVIDSQMPCLRQLMDAYETSPGSIVGVQPVPQEAVSRYGIVDVAGRNGRCNPVRDLVEKPRPDQAPSNLAILGRYILEPEIFTLIEKTKPGAKDEIQLTDAIRALLDHRPVYAYEFEGRRYDVGDRMGYLEATIDYALKREDLAEPLLNYMAKKVEEGLPAPRA